MHIEYLVTMMNDIATFHVGQGDLEFAAAGVESHVSRFWEKRMRQQILAHFRAGGAGLNEVSLAALALLAREGPAAPQLHARDQGTGSDAG
jgi:formate dehydrogenase subunit delta